MKIVIPGGAGQIGTVLARAFHARGDDVVVLTRHVRPRPWRTVRWNGETIGAWAAELDGCDVVINLAGRSVNCRYTSAHRLEMLQSRVLSTRVVGQAIAASRRPPRVWLQAGTATIYAHRYDAPNDERTGVIGGTEPDVPEDWRFSIDVARAWEDTFAAARTDGTRKVLMRSAMTMTLDAGGVFDTLLGLVRHGLGGPIGDGRQFVSWIHGDDFVSAVEWLIAHEDVSGVMNLASPNPLPNADFMRALREAWGTSVGVPVSSWILELGTIVMRTESGLILKSRRVVPGRLLERGFVFQHPSWPAAAHDLVTRWRAAARRAA